MYVARLKNEKITPLKPYRLNNTLLIPRHNKFIRL